MSPKHPVNKAFVVGTQNADCCVICLTRTGSEAKKLGRQSPWLQDCLWTDLRVRREPRLDPLAATKPNTLIDGGNPEDAEMMRSLGWREIEGPSTACESCGLCQWEIIPESHLREYKTKILCKTCIEKEDAKKN
jgi:hypothetical protein